MSALEHSVEPEEDLPMPEECLPEMKRHKMTVNLHISCVPDALIRCEDYSNLRRLLRETVYVLKFV